MKQKLLLLLTALCFGFVSGVKADPIETVGDLSTGWWTAFSNTYTLEGYGKYHFQFTTTNANDGYTYKTWLLVATNGNDSHGGGGTEYFVWRADNYAWGQGTNSNDAPTQLACSNTYSGSNMQAAMNGASVDMIITRESHNIYVTATITPTNGDSEFTMSFSYLFGNASSDNIGLFFTIENAQVVLNTAEQTKEYLKVFSNDFEDAETYTNGWTVSGNSQQTLNGSKYMHLYNNVSASRSFESAVSGAEDYVMEFDWNIGSNNGTASGGTVLRVTGLDNSSTVTLFMAEKKNQAWSSVFNLQNGSGTDLGTGELTGDGYQKDAALTFWYHFRLAGNETEGTTLTVTKNSAGSLNTYTSVLATYKLSDDCIAPNGITVTAANRAACAGIDDLFVYSYSTSETVTDPTIEAPAYAGANRTVSITSGISSKGNDVHTYYTLDGTDPTGLSTEYTTALTITENCTVKAITISSSSASSSVVSRAITVGKLTLNAPTFAKTAYSAGNYTVEITSNQSTLDYVPASPVIKYSIDGGSEETYSSAIAVPAGSTVAAHVEADDYTNSSTSNLTTYARPVFAEVWSLDFAGQATEDKGGVTIDTENESFTVGATSFYPITATSFTSNSNFAVASNNNLLLRNTGSQGLYSQASGARDIAVGNLTEGQYVIINCVGLDKYNSVGGVGEFKSDYSTSNQIVLRATADGNMSINIARYIYIQSIAVYDVVENVSKTITSAGWATYCSPYALDFSSSIANLTAAYIITGVADSKLTLVEVDGTVPANTGLLLKGEGACTIPVATSSSVDVSGNKLVGVTSSQSLAATTGYVLMGSPKVGFYKNTNAFTLGANTAYLLAGFDAGARTVLYLDEDDAPMAINAIEAADAKAAGLKDGKYLINGRIVMVNNGKAFGANGQILK